MKVIWVVFLLAFLISGCSGQRPEPSAVNTPVSLSAPDNSHSTPTPEPDVLITGTTVSPAPDNSRVTPSSQPAFPKFENIPTPVPQGTEKTSSLPAAAGDLTFPIRAAFYYPWFPQSWKQSNMDPFTHYHPLLGFYSEDDAQVIQQHIVAMKYGKIQVGISSWWGQGHYTDGRVPALLKAGLEANFYWALYIENEGIGDPSPDAIRSDLEYIRDHYASSPAYLKIGGRFVVFVYAQPADACGMADRWKQGNTVGAYVVLKVFSGYQKCSSQPESWHQYAPAGAEKQQGVNSYTISPGFWKATEEQSRLDRDVARWSKSIQAMISSKANFQLITTFNEWGEGTAVESAQEWASPSGYGAYLDALHNDGVMP